RGRPLPLSNYTQRFPALLTSPETLEAITFEEFRLRHQAGENPSAEEYHRRFGVETESWPELEAAAASPAAGFSPLDQSLPRTRILSSNEPPPGATSAYRHFLLDDKEKAEAVDFQVHADLSVIDEDGNASGEESSATRFPAAGSEFLGFQLLEELG